MFLFEKLLRIIFRITSTSFFNAKVHFAFVAPFCWVRKLPFLEPGVRIPPHPRLISWACSCSRLLRANRPLFDDLQLLPQFDHAPVWENTAKVYGGINHAIAADHRARIDHAVATDRRTMATHRLEFSEL